MNEHARPSYLRLVSAVVIGLALGLVLLVQTILTYYYVSGALVRQEAQRDADRTASGLARAVRLSGANDPAHLAPVVAELLRERPQRIAWIRVVGYDGRLLAESGKPSGAPFVANPPGSEPRNRLVTAYPLVLPVGGSVPAPATPEIAI